MSVTREELRKTQEEERMRRLRIIFKGVSQQKSWKEIAADLNISVAAARTCWFRYRYLLSGSTETDIADVQPIQDPPAETKVDSGRCQCGHTETTQKQGVFMSERTKSLSELVSLYHTHYLVDTENVNGTEIYALIRMLGDQDALHLFYTDNSSNLPLGALEIILKKQGQVHLEHCSHGEKNALDFQILSAMGFMIAFSNPETQRFVIISKDHGYDPTVQFWRDKGINVSRMEPYFDLQKREGATTDLVTEYYNQHPEQQKRMRHATSCHLGAVLKAHNIKAKNFDAIATVFLRYPQYTESMLANACGGNTAKAIMKLDPQIIRDIKVKVYSLVNRTPIIYG